LCLEVECIWTFLLSIIGKGEPKVTKPNWRIMVDENTNMKITHFFKAKNGMCEPTCELINKFKDMKTEVKCLRMDSTGGKKICNNDVEAEIGNLQ
jgi:hypothetical protein